MKILIVEDDVVLSRLLNEYLLRLGHERVQACLTGEEACVAIEKGYFDCAFVDLRLPDADGLQMLDAIKRRDPSIPVVMMSGYPTMEYAIQAMRKGASDFLTKPFTLQDLALALERVTKERVLLLENLSLQLECRAQKQLEKANRELERKAREQASLFAISRRLDEIRSSEELFPCIVEIASELSKSPDVGLFISPPEQRTLLPVSCHGLVGRQDLTTFFERQSERLKGLLDTGSNHVCLAGDNLFGGSFEGGEAKNFCCWPLRIRGEFFGFLMISQARCIAQSGSSDEKLVDFLMKKASLAIENMALYESLISNFYGILKSLVNAIEAKDPYTRKHSDRVTCYAIDIARVIDCSTSQMEALRTVGYLHDIGKIGIADNILHKPGPLTAEEYELIRRHPAIGDSIVADLGFADSERAIIKHHHESWDGSGYPDGLAGEDIPILARIVTVADAYDAMTSRRAYREAMSLDAAIHEIRSYRGRQFDPVVADAFIESLQDMERIKDAG
ncbi:MAG: HD domain-containing phosphohydrolase [Syntrophobacteraceae bacterium]|jgi:putative nucleotidyltransferase with HDIG domain